MDMARMGYCGKLGISAKSQPRRSRIVGVTAWLH